MNLKLQNKTAETAYNVYVTKDYSIFRRLVGNRDIPESRISKIVESIQQQELKIKSLKENYDKIVSECMAMKQALLKEVFGD